MIFNIFFSFCGNYNAAERCESEGQSIVGGVKTAVYAV